MKPGDLVRVEPRWGDPRSLLYESISGESVLRAAVKGEHLILLGTKRGRDGNIKVLHPTVGVCFINAKDLEVVDETR